MNKEENPEEDILVELEKGLILKEQYIGFYREMPDKCQKVVKTLTADKIPLKIGINKKLGWYIMEYGESPKLVWQENKMK